jgi:hypothetical protein
MIQVAKEYTPDLKHPNTTSILLQPTRLNWCLSLITEEQAIA